MSNEIIVAARSAAKQIALLTRENARLAKRLARLEGTEGKPVRAKKEATEVKLTAAERRQLKAEAEAKAERIAARQARKAAAETPVKMTAAEKRQLKAEAAAKAERVAARQARKAAKEAPVAKPARKAKNEMNEFLI